MLFLGTTFVVAAFWIWKDIAEHLAKRWFPTGPWWKIWSVEFLVFFPPMLLLFSLLPDDSDPDFSLWGILAGAILAMALQWGYAYLRKGNQK